MMNRNEIEIELQRSLQGTHQYRSMSSGRGMRGTSTVAVHGESSSGLLPHVPTVSATGLLYPELSYEVVGALIEVHRWLGPGQLESIYQRAVEKELALRGIPFEAQVAVPALYKGDDMGELVLDLIVDDSIVLELKAVTSILPVHRAQLMSYLRATGCRLGLLVNFHVPVMIQGIKRIAL